MRIVTGTVYGLMLLFGVPQLLAQPGQSGMAFLKLGVSGRGTGMADAGSAIASGAAATYYNPAGLVAESALGLSSQLMFMHREWIQDTRMEFLGASIALGENNALGAAVNSTTVSDIELRTMPGPADGTFTARDFSLGLSFAHRFSPDLRIGVTGKFLYQKIFVNEGTGYAADFGGIWRTPLDSLTLGAAFCNVGSMGALRTEATTLPSLFRFGPAYAFCLAQAQQIQMTVAADFLRIFPERRNYLNAGAELKFNSLFAARGGYQFGSEGRGMTLGVGIAYGMLVLDYAYAKISSDLGDAHTISLALNL
jgi:hypothetical protein